MENIKNKLSYNDQNNKLWNSIKSNKFTVDDVKNSFDEYDLEILESAYSFISKKIISNIAIGNIPKWFGPYKISRYIDLANHLSKYIYDNYHKVVKSNSFDKWSKHIFMTKKILDAFADFREGKNIAQITEWDMRNLILYSLGKDELAVQAILTIDNVADILSFKFDNYRKSAYNINNLLRYFTKIHEIILQNYQWKNMILNGEKLWFGKLILEKVEKTIKKLTTHNNK